MAGKQPTQIWYEQMTSLRIDLGKITPRPFVAAYVKVESH